MLTYAFQSLSQSNFYKFAAYDFDNIHDIFSTILGKCVTIQLNQLFYR